MVNPFDRSFFKFLVGFVFILLASFTIVIVANSYNNDNEASVLMSEEL